LAPAAPRPSPDGAVLIQLVATYGHKAGTVFVAIFFALAATWDCVWENLVLGHEPPPASKRRVSLWPHLS
jgi:hypothetical protein